MCNNGVIYNSIILNVDYMYSVYKPSNSYQSNKHIFNVS